MDLYASLAQDVTVIPGERKLIPAGISIAIPEGFEGQIRPRSGLAIQKGIGEALQNGPVAGYPVGDVRIVIYDGGMHAVEAEISTTDRLRTPRTLSLTTRFEGSYS